MPPKGWRKNNETVTPTAAKAVDPVSIDELLFPKATVNRIAKSVLDEHSLSKDSLIALQRAATVFVNHLFFFARTAARDQGRKTVNSQEVIAALEKSEFASFIPIVRKELESYNKIQELKKKHKEHKDEDITINEAESANTTVQEEPKEGDEPAAKKTKDNAGHAVGRNTSGEDTDEEGADENPDTISQDEEDKDETEEAEERAVQPMEAIDLEEKELRGEDFDNDTVGNEDEAEEED
ncbi:hypothetical protein BABINDRAFT_14321 [Babjeviella inositovora NRRL Y-12698]|uniref:DNA polymerase epsilon subunit D n=1 Tax=Babjeviella inositovora NRRL Y-12698 TaxID=984486 RepID=A0A1E3QNY1_9ASCO|nr:uncharacterized protein BABINDRAFT_14321 [Babjeviella inositovora NRRL Y-12698]ODQ78687.1 hypothetical protein BABINDRAFT_14321 [Babjeviella inositovora NRRL Y-12698]